MKAKSVFICNQCGNETPRWQGQCPACGAWNSIVEFEDKKPAANKASSGTKLAASKPKKLRELDASDRQIRFSTGLGELDRVLGGGGVKGSLVLVCGAPGIGKSTLLLQICAYLGKTQKILYVSGEESEQQLKMRADRLRVESENLYVLSETDLDEILSAFGEVNPDILIADSIQTLFTPDNTSAPGVYVRAVHQVFQDTKLLFGGRRHQILPPFRQDGQICDTPLDVLGIVDVGRCKLYQMTNAPAYQIAVALQITVLTAGSTEDFCVGHSDRWLFCYN